MERTGATQGAGACALAPSAIFNPAEISQLPRLPDPARLVCTWQQASVRKSMVSVSRLLKPRPTVARRLLFQLVSDKPFPCAGQSSHGRGCKVRIAVEKVPAVHADAGWFIPFSIQAQVLAGELDVPLFVQDLADRQPDSAAGIFGPVAVIEDYAHGEGNVPAGIGRLRSNGGSGQGQGSDDN